MESGMETISLMRILQTRNDSSYSRSETTNTVAVEVQGCHSYPIPDEEGGSSNRRLGGAGRGTLGSGGEKAGRLVGGTVSDVHYQQPDPILASDRAQPQKGEVPEKQPAALGDEYKTED